MTDRVPAVAAAEACSMSPREWSLSSAGTAARRRWSRGAAVAPDPVYSCRSCGTELDEPKTSHVIASCPKCGSWTPMVKGLGSIVTEA